MLEGFVQRFREKKAIRRWQRSKLGLMLASHTAEYFKYDRLADLGEENKKRLIENFYQTVINVAQAPNPFLAMREQLASYVLGFAQLQVLCLTEEEKDTQFYSDCPYISGTLHHQIDKAAEHVDELKEILWKFPDTSKEALVSFCNSRCVVHLYYLNGFNLVRSEFDDHDPEKDWLRPLIQSMLISDEDQLRTKLGMPSLLPGPIDALKHSTFLNFVTAGDRNPWFTWESHYKKSES